MDNGARREAYHLVPGSGSGSDDEWSVTAIDEVSGGLERAVGHAVHVGGKDSVTMTTRIPVLSPYWTWPRQRGSFPAANDS